MSVSDHPVVLFDPLAFELAELVLLRVDIPCLDTTHYSNCQYNSCSSNVDVLRTLGGQQCTNKDLDDGGNNHDNYDPVLKLF